LGLFKHAPDFGIKTPKRNPATLDEFEKGLIRHLDDPATIEKGTYLYVPGSKVYFNPNTNVVVILDKDGNFVSGWRLIPGSPQWLNFINNGVLR
jgi:filamentous hemagglutinin